MGHRDAVLHIRAVAVNACRRSGRPARDLGLTAELRPGSRKRTTDRPIALSVTLQESLDGPDSLQCACAGATHNAVICVRVAASFAQRLYARNRRSARLITKYADEFGDHRDRQVLDGICRAVHKHACRQRPLFGMSGRFGVSRKGWAGRAQLEQLLASLTCQRTGLLEPDRPAPIGQLRKARAERGAVTWLVVTDGEHGQLAVDAMPASCPLLRRPQCRVQLRTAGCQQGHGFVRIQPSRGGAETRRPARRRSPRCAGASRPAGLAARGSACARQSRSHNPSSAPGPRCFSTVVSCCS